jgi:hypothetical protein
MQSRQQNYQRLHRIFETIERGRRDELHRVRHEALDLERQWQALQPHTGVSETLQTAGAVQHEMRWVALRERQRAELEPLRRELARQETAARRKLLEATQASRAIQRLRVRLQDEHEASLRRDEQARLDERALWQVRE